MMMDDLPVGDCQPLLDDYLRLHAKWNANSAAAIFATQRVSWQQLDSGSDRIARALINSGLGTGDRVATLLANSPELLMCILGVTRAGGIVVPIPGSLHPSAMQNILEDAAPHFLFSDQEGASDIEATFATAEPDSDFIRVSVGFESRSWMALSRFLDAASESAALPQLEPHQPFNISYTSGTTGLPKGIIHSHGCRTAYGTCIAPALAVGPYSVQSITLPLSSNYGIGMIIPALFTGATMVFLENWDADSFIDMVAANNVTHGALVAPQYQDLLEKDDATLQRLGSVQVWLSAGSAVDEALLAEMRARLGGRLILNYGNTEGVGTLLFPEDLAAGAAANSAGKPFPGFDIAIIDQDGNHVPAGTSGEICGASPVLMSGYFKQPELTRALEWRDKQGRLFLKTGDLGFIDAAGFLNVSGRIKEMIVSGAQNVYPIDLETVLLQHEAVREAAVVGIPHERWGETPAAAVVLRRDHEVSARQLRDWANEKLGKYQRLSDVQIVASLPRNQMGKVVKGELFPSESI